MIIILLVKSKTRVKENRRTEQQDMDEWIDESCNTEVEEEIFHTLLLMIRFISNEKLSPCVMGKRISLS